MNGFSRRSFMKLTGATAVAGAALGAPQIARAAAGNIVIVGGGVGGATTARYLKLANPEISVTLIEPNASYHTCFMSNEVLAGERTLEGIEVKYDGLKAMGIDVVQDAASGIDPAAKTVTTAGGKTFNYDRCVVAPGISFVYDALEGYSADLVEKMPHAWQAGPQTALLRSQLEAMDDGGLVMIVPPPNPFRCPPGPYERASLIASYLKEHKPKSKIIIIDPKEQFSKQGLFTQAWKMFYGFETDNAMIEWHRFSDVGGISAVNGDTMEVKTDFETYKASVINYIPPQKAGKIALARADFDRAIQLATSMPKSGYSANSQGKVVAATIVSALAGTEPPEPSYVNTCYSIAAKDHGFSVAAVYRYDPAEDVIAGVKGAGGLTPTDSSPEQFKREVAFAHSWYNNICRDTWG